MKNSRNRWRRRSSYCGSAAASAYTFGQLRLTTPQQKRSGQQMTQTFGQNRRRPMMQTIIALAMHGFASGRSNNGTTAPISGPWPRSFGASAESDSLSSLKWHKATPSRRYKRLPLVDSKSAGSGWDTTITPTFADLLKKSQVIRRACVKRRASRGLSLSLQKEEGRKGSLVPRRRSGACPQEGLSGSQASMV
jgi:hypothetical protein